ncbi:MAG: 50S ribosomal protein L11 [Candidatus Babeliales bacterium]
MSKQVKAKVKMTLEGGAATPASSVGAVLGQHKVKLLPFCKEFNEKTSNKKGEQVPVEVMIYQDGSFDMVIKTPSVSYLLKNKAGITKGSSKPNQDTVGKITMKDAEDIARIKLPDLNVDSIEQAVKSIVGSAKSMGIIVVS